MKFSLAAFSVVVLAVVTSGAASFLDGTFTSKRVTMGFLNHGGMWSDLIIMSVATGLAFPYLARSRIIALSSLVIALLVTMIAHVHWAASMRHDGTTGHMFHIYQTGTWYLDLSRAGWMHVLVMTMLLTVALMYAVSPVPVKIVVAMSLLLTVHVFLGMVQPAWYCTGKLWTWPNFAPPLLAAGLIWGIAMLKLRLARGNL
jgi:hypothetical protein